MLKSIILFAVFSTSASADLFVISGQVASVTNPSFHVGDLIHGTLLTDSLCTECSVNHFDWDTGGMVGGGLLALQLQIGPVISGDARGGADGGPFTEFDRAELKLTGAISGGASGVSYIRLFPGGFDMYPGEDVYPYFFGGEVRGSVNIVPTPEPASIGLLALVMLVTLRSKLAAERRFGK